MKFLAGVLATLIAGIVIAAVVIFGGFANVSAADGHSAIAGWLLHTTMHNAVEARAEGTTVPSNLVGDDRIQRGARSYDEMCAVCHLKPGQEESVVRRGLTPTPPRLDRPGHWSAAEQFWIVSNGIQMTGMPAWGPTHSDEELWEVIGFLQRLPELSADEYSAMVARDAETAADGHDHTH